MYFTVFAAIECYIKVCWPKYSHGWCTVRRAKQIIACIFLGLHLTPLHFISPSQPHHLLAYRVGSAAYSSLRFGQFRLRECFFPGYNESVMEVRTSPHRTLFAGTAIGTRAGVPDHALYAHQRGAPFLLPPLVSISG